MDSPSDLDVGRSDVQIDAARIGTLWGPELTGGNARLRHTVEPGVTVEADAGMLHVTNSGEAGDRNGYIGRLGLLLHSQDKHWAFGAGVGGGTSATAGNWSAADIHGVLSGANRYIRPVVSGGVGYSAPLGERRTFVVPGEGDGPTTLQLPRNVFAQITRSGSPALAVASARWIAPQIANVLVAMRPFTNPDKLASTRPRASRAVQWRPLRQGPQWAQR